MAKYRALGIRRFLRVKGGERIKVIKAALPREIDKMELHTLADLHIGDPLCDARLIKQRIDHIQSTPSAYCLLNGDICNWASKSSVSDIYGETLKPMEQIAEFVGLFEPIKDKIIAVCPGNHERRAYHTEGIDITGLACAQLGIRDRYAEGAALVFLRVGERSDNTKESSGSGRVRQICYVLYMLHGSGGGRKEGAKAIRLADMASIVDADIYIHSHTHLPMVMRQAYHRVDQRNSTMAKVDKLFVNTGATLDYGGYGEQYEFKPSSKATPVIYLGGRKKEFTARL